MLDSGDTAFRREALLAINKRKRTASLPPTLFHHALPLFVLLPLPPSIISFPSSSSGMTGLGVNRERLIAPL